MKKKIILFCIICLGVFLCGCEGELKTVKREESPPAESSDTSQFGVKYCAVSELKKTKMSDITYKADNLRLPDTVDFSCIGEVAVLDMETEQIDVNKKRKFTKNCLGWMVKTSGKKKMIFWFMMTRRKKSTVL